MLEICKTTHHADIHTSEQAKTMLAKDLKTLYRYKYGKNPPNGKNKQGLLQDWILVKENPGVEYETIIWTAEQGVECERPNEEDIELKHTELGKQAKMTIAEESQ